MKLHKSIEKKRQQKDSYVVSVRNKGVIIVDDLDNIFFYYKTKNELDGSMHSVLRYNANIFYYLSCYNKYSESYFLY